MRAGSVIFCGIGLAAMMAGPDVSHARQQAPGAWTVDPNRVQFVDILDFSNNSDARFGGAFRMTDQAFSSQRGEAVTEAWRSTPSGAVDRLRLIQDGERVRADGAPLPLNPRDPAMLADDRYSLSYTRGWPARSYDPDTGLQVEVIPHAGVGLSSDGGSAEAGATIRVGSGLERLVPEGDAAFDEDQARWYLFAAGSGRAVGYNFARTRDGDYVRSGMSHDSGSFIGDAQVGVAWRRGDLQTSFGYVYREHKVDGLAGGDFDRKRSEGVVAFQLSIRPDW